jgi:hypothetical protein
MACTSAQLPICCYKLVIDNMFGEMDTREEDGRGDGALSTELWGEK